MRFHFLILMMLVTGACSSDPNTLYLRQTAGAARDHIMLVGENPDTFGKERLEALSQYYPDLGLFIQRKGQPRYYAETKNSGNSYFILYYPVKRQAFACRTTLDSGRRIEFSGPYPITPNELASLRELDEEGRQNLKR